MHRTLLLPLLLLFVVSTHAQQAVSKKGGAYLEVDKMIHDYGTVKKGSNGDCFFLITNTGDAPLTISKCESNCGCTVADCPKEPIAPGASTKLKVHYDTERVGRINRSVTMYTNSTNARQLQVLLQGNVAE